MQDWTGLPGPIGRSCSEKKNILENFLSDRAVGPSQVTLARALELREAADLVDLDRGSRGPGTGEVKI